MTYKISLIWSRVVLSSLLTALLVWPPGLFAWTEPAVAFSGQATVLRVTTHGITTTTTTVSDTGPLPSSGGALQTSLLSISFPGVLTADVAHATTIGQADRARSEASVADVTLTAGGNTIKADLLRSSAMAVCTTGGPAVSGSSEIAELVINGQTIAVSGQPNQTITLPAGVEVIINEQSSSISGNTGTITVNALHVIVPSVGLVPGVDVVVSSAHADVTCQGVPACVGKDFVTGGGFITGTPSRAKGNFGVGGGIKNDGSLWGHLEYIDHGGSNGPKVHGTGVTKYVTSVPNSTPNTREIDGTAEVNGQSGYTYRVVVADNDDLGGNDSFSIDLFDSSGNPHYSAGGNLVGGEIQLHKPCH
jgi:hypothetical protein